uniref:UDP-glucuronosyltransferase n=1 Tax=Timema monikensis TaxID=170555 RepID=A0A7R9HL67_9NEOP|nr:unnamed protein product [Timema monikensis]
MKLQALLPLFLMCFSWPCCQVYAAKILALLTLTSHSHHIWNRSLMKALAARGHQVTVVSPDSDPNSGPNLTYIVLENSYEHIRDNFKYETGLGDTFFQTLDLFGEWCYMNCEHQLSSKGGKQILGYPDGKMFDLIISEAAYTECFMALIPKFGNPPVVLVSAVGIPPNVDRMTGTPVSPSYIPDYRLPFSDHMDFWERMQNLLTYFTNEFFYSYIYFPRMQEIANRHLGHEVTSLEELRRNISVILSSTVNGFDTPRPLMPNVIPVGGMHLKPAGPLPKDLKTFLDGAKNGAIFFALGSNLRSDQLEPKAQQALFDAFSQLPQRILWKFETEDIKGKPDNVMISKWLPQSDVLGHPNVKLFISHCGWLSTQEAIYFGVPVVGIPFYLDQHNNLFRLKELGVGEGLSFTALTKDNVLKTINAVIQNTSYASNMKRLSAIFHDQPETPLERAVYWTEYVLRHGGAPHLRSVAVDLPLYQYLLLDVGLVLLLLLGTVSAALVLLLRLLRRVLRNKSKQKQQ